MVGRIQVQGAEGVRPVTLGQGPLLTSAGQSWAGVSVELHQILPRKGGVASGPPPKEHGLLAVLEGSVDILGRGGKSPLFEGRPGGVCHLAGCYPHSVTAIEGSALVAAIRVDDAWFHRLGLDTAPAGFGLSSVPGDATSRGLLSAIVDTLRAGVPVGRLFAESLSTAFLAHVIRDLLPDAAPRHGRLTASQARTVVDYVHAHLARDLSLAELAGTVHMSARRFSEAFRLVFGTSPHRYVTEVRIQAVIARLSARELTLEDLAEQTGFSSAGHLSRAFRSITGETPRGYGRRR